MALADAAAVAVVPVAVAALVPDDEMLEHAAVASPSPTAAVMASAALARRDILLI